MKWLNDFNSTNGKIVAGIVMAIMVVGTVCGMEIAGRHFNEIVLLEVFTFIATWAGISYAQFAKKRDTFKPALPADEDGPAPEAPMRLTSEVPRGVDPDLASALQTGASRDAHLAARSHFGEMGVL